MEMLGANCEFAQFINCAAHYVNPCIAQQFINCCANCQSYYAWSIYFYKLRTKLRCAIAAICELLQPRSKAEEGGGQALISEL